MPSPLPCAFAAACVFSTAAAQTRVIPADRAATEGHASHQYPWSYSEVRFQQIWEGAEIAATSAILTRIDFRRDGANAAAQTARSWNYTATLFETSTHPAQMTTSWSLNRGGSPGTVVVSGPVNVPAAAPLYPTPQPWSLPLIFAAPFTFQRSNGHLLLEVEGSDPANLFDSWPIDAENQWRSVRGDSVRVSAPACTGIGGERVGLGISGSSTLVLGGTMTVSMVNTTLTVFANWVGFSNQTYAGFFLPLDLTLIGADGCFLGTDIAAQLAGPGPFAWAIPNMASLEGQVVFTQALGIAPGANGANFLTSDVFQVRIGGPTPAPGLFQSVYRRSDLGLPTGFMSGASYHGAIARMHGTFN
jgi:hypothetical protein